MGVLDSFGALVASIVASVVLLVFAILSFFVTVFIVDVGAGLANYNNLNGGFVVLSASILAGSAIVAGASPVSVRGSEGE